MDTKFSRNAYYNFLIWGVLSSLGVTVSTFIDAVLVGNFVGNEGLAAVNLSTPIFLFYALLGVTIGFGANVMIGNRLGASRVKDANIIFQTQLALGLAASALCLVAGVAFRNQLITMLGADSSLFEPAQNYLTMVFFCAPFFIFYQIMAASVRTDADPRLASAASATVIVTNLVLDLVFMKVLDMGIFGASLALSIAEILGFCVLLTHFLRKRSLIRLGIIKAKLSAVKTILKNGFGVGSAYAFQAIVMIVFNTLLVQDTGHNGVLNVALFGIIYTMGLVPFAIYEGASNAVSPVVTIFAGERDGKSMLSVQRLAIITACTAGVIVAVLFIIFAEPIIRFFGITDAAYLSTAILAFRIFSLSVLFSGINTVATAFWQATGRSKLAGCTSVFRNLVLMSAIGIILITGYGAIGLGASYLLSEVVCFLGVVSVEIFSSSRAYIEKHYRTADRVFEKSYIIQKESIEQVSKDIETVCEEWDIGPKQNFFIHLVVEELILNIIKFGLRDNEAKRYIAIKLLDDNGEYTVRIRDNVRSYNPFESSGDNIDNAVINMIRTKTKYNEYQRKLIFNYLYFVM